jgi:hypothetical protein
MSDKEDRVWYLLPIFFGLIGGIVGYVVLREHDPEKANNCIWFGLTATLIAFVAILAILQ